MFNYLPHALSFTHHSSYAVSLALIGLALVIPFSGAYAQGGDAAASEIEEIVVTAMRRETQLNDVPQSVQVFSGFEIEQSGIGDMNEIILEIPGATTAFKTTPGTAEYNFRGTGGQGALGDMAIGFYIDDVPYYTPDNPYAPAIRFFDMEAVEVLRGPQGTLYGQGSMGGTIIVRTANPNLEKFEARARASAYDLKDGEMGRGLDATVSIPLVQDVAALRITGGYHTTPGLAESPDFPGSDDIDDGTIKDIRAKLLIEPSDTFSILATYWDSNDDGDFAPVYFDNDPATIISGGVEGDRDNRTQLYSVVATWDASWGTFKSSTSLNKYEDELLLGVGVVLPPPAAFTINLFAESESFNQEFVLSSPAGEIEWVVGATYTDADRETDFAQDLSLITPPISLFSVATITRTETKQWAVFGEISKSFMDGFIRPLIGVRYYSDDRDFRDADQGGGAVSDFDETFSTFSPRFNLSIQPSETQSYYINISKGFRSGNFNPQGFVDLANLFGVSTNSANPEAEVWAYEVGARLQFLDGNLSVEPAIYYNDYSDYQFAGVVGGAALVSLSLDEVEAQGIDLVVNYQTGIEGLSFGFSGNVNETEASSVNDTLAMQVASLSDGDQLPYTPEWSYSANAQYQAAVGNGLEWFARIALVAQGAQLGNSEIDSENVRNLSIRVGISGRNWSATLFGDNLENDRDPFAIRGPTTQTRRDTRSIGLELTYSLD